MGNKMDRVRFEQSKNNIQQCIANSNEYSFEVDAELLGEIGNKERRLISIEDYKNMIERLYFK